ncbi:MAG TPA: malto-oligosyltrehalose trehalohydrolase [Gemmatimonadaceae bacterium]
MTPGPTLGAIWNGFHRRTRFRVWAPEATQVDLVLGERAGATAPMQRPSDGYFATTRHDAPPGTLYQYRVDGRGPFPDPASRYQPHGVHGPSQVIDPAAFTWSDAGWPGVASDRLVFYELHVGTFTSEGTFRAGAARLNTLAELGITAIVVMPVADFPGDRNWGYDGVAPFAPARCYGTPDDLRSFVDTAHRVGLAVHLDVVYNHLGPDGAYQGTFSRQYYSERHQSPWGQGINFDGAGSTHVRRYVLENALHWMHEYHLDGLRLDATHAIMDDSAIPIVAEIASAIQASDKERPHPRVVIAEDHRNAAYMIRERGTGGWGLDGLWSDDFHHATRRAVAGDHDGYFADFDGSTRQIAATIRDGWFYRGQYSTFFEEPRGTDPTHLPLSRFVFFLQNHDQVGNRAYGERLHHDISLAAYRAASVLLLLAPETPLLFMGQEWAASTPFHYFTDHNEELGRAVTAGRRREFRRFARFADPEAAAEIPDPQAIATFLASRLVWDEVAQEPHAGILRLYRRLLALRQSEPALYSSARSGCGDVAIADGGAIILRRAPSDARTVVAIVRLDGAGVTRLPVPARGTWEVLLTTEDTDVTVDPQPPGVSLDEPSVRLARPGAVVLASMVPQS